MTKEILDEMQRCRKIIFALIGRKLSHTYTEDYDDAYQYACIEFLEHNKNTIKDDVLGYLLRYSWQYLSKDQNRRYHEKIDHYSNDHIDIIIDMPHDALTDIIMQHPVKKHTGRVDYKKLYHFDIFHRSLPKMQRLIIQMRRDNAPTSEICNRIHHDGKYVCVTEYTVRNKYKNWLPWYLKNKDKMSSNLIKIKNEIIKRVAMLHIDGHRSSDIAKMLSIKPSSAWAYVHYARRILSGERTSSFRSHITAKNRLRSSAYGKTI
jgi:hypothetical protein